MIVDSYKSRWVTCCKIAAKGTRKINPVEIGFSIEPAYHRGCWPDWEKKLNEEGFYLRVAINVYAGPKSRAVYPSLDTFDDDNKFLKEFIERHPGAALPSWVKETFFYGVLNYLHRKYIAVNGNSGNTRFVRYIDLAKSDEDMILTVLDRSDKDLLRKLGGASK